MNSVTLNQISDLKRGEDDGEDGKRKENGSVLSFWIAMTRRLLDDARLATGRTRSSRVDGVGDIELGGNTNACSLDERAGSHDNIQSTYIPAVL